jgi:hypothetical protein
MTEFQNILWVAVLAMQLPVAAALLLVGYRRFPLAATYAAAICFTTVINIGVYLFIDRADARFAAYTVIGEVIRVAIAFTVVASLAIEAVPGRRRMISAATAAAGTLAVFAGLTTSGMTNVMTFCAALANLTAWFGLVMHRPFDTTRLLIAGGLGIQLAGGAFAQSLRGMHSSAAMPGAVFAIVADFICLFVWWHAFTRYSPETTSD